MTKPITILYVDDYPLDRELVRDALEKEDSGFRVIEAASRVELEARLTEGDYDLVLSDFNILGFEGLQVIETVHTELGPLPVVILTGTGSEEVAAEAMKRGAADYVVKKPDHIRRLPLTLRAVLERARAEEALRESEEKYRTLIQKIQAAVVVHGSDTRILTCNPMAQALLGLTEDQLLGKTAIDPAWHFFREDGTVLPSAEYPVNQVLATGQPLRDFVVGIRRPDKNDEVWVLVNADPVFGKEDEIIQVIVTFSNITERKRAEESLRDSERRLTEAQRIAHIGYWERDLEAGRIILSDEACRIFGLAPQEVPLTLEQWHQRWLELIHPEDQPRTAQAAAEALRDGPPYNVEYRVVRPNGEVRFIHSEATVNRDKAGRPRSMLGMMQDITERKRAEEALRQSEWKYREIFDNVLDSLFLVEVTEDGHFRNLEMNPAFETTTGLTRTHLIGKIIEEVAPEEVAAIVNAKYRHCVETGEPIEEEVELDLPVGRRYFQSTLIPARDETGKIHRLIGISHDITERKKAEMQILASEQLFRALVENSPDFIARYDREFRRVYVNPAIQKLFGKPLENVLNQTPADQSPVYAPQIYIEQLRQVIETGDERTVEMPFRTAQGEMRWGHMRFVPEFGPDGQVTSVLAIGRDIHEIKESERRFRMLAENFPDFIVRLDRDYRHTYVNPAVEKAFGLPAEAFIGKTLQELPQLHKPERFDALLALIRRAFEEGVANNSEVFWETQMGQRIFEIRHVPEKDATGNVVSVLGIAHDITERKQAEQERLAHLRFFECMDQINRAIQGTNDLEQMMSEVLDVALSIFECDRAWLIYPCDPEAASWGMPIERTRPEYPGAPALGGAIPVTPDTIQLFQTVRDANGPVQFGPGLGHPLPVQNRELYRVQSMLAMAVYPKLDKPYMFGLHQCSHRRVWTPEEERLFQEIGRRLADALTGLLAYRDLQESEARFRTLVNHAADAFYLHDAQGTILDVNRQACESLGYSREELIGMTPYDFDVGFGRSFHDQMRARLDAGEVIAIDTRHRRKDGSVFPVEVRIRPFWQGERRFSVSLARDITERKRAQEEIHRLNQELEQRVLDRTAQLEATNKELEAFAYSVSHDLRAPLRHIDGFLELLQQRMGGKLDERSQHYMTVISYSARRMGQLIDDLLSFSRMGRNEMSKTPVDLGVLVQEVIREFSPEKGRSIHWRITTLPTVTGDRAMLRLVLVNLIANALKFTQGRSQTEIEIGCQAGDKETIIFIRDNGVGFDMAYADKLFGVFQRLHRADEFEGTGIGLANVRRIIQRHGGRTWAEGVINQGATFYFSLPLDLAPASVTPQTANSARAQTG